MKFLVGNMINPPPPLTSTYVLGTLGYKVTRDPDDFLGRLSQPAFARRG